MNTAASNNHTAIEQALCDSMASFIDTRNALTKAQTRFAVLDADPVDGSKYDLKIGKARREVKQLTSKLEEQQSQHRKLAQEELAARYALTEEAHRQARLACEEFATQEIVLTTRLEVAQKQLARVEARLNEQGARGRRLMVSPLKIHVEGRAKDALVVVKKATKKVKELTAELAQAQSAHQESTARLAFAAAQLEQLLKAGESHLRVLSLEKISAQLDDPHTTVDRLQVEELLANWAQGFTEVVEPPLAAPYNVTFYPRGASIYYWFDSGHIAATAIFDCPSKTGHEQWSKLVSSLTFDDVRERLERQQQVGQL